MTAAAIPEKCTGRSVCALVAGYERRDSLAREGPGDPRGMTMSRAHLTPFVRRHRVPLPLGL